jgi:hypothetical protein
MPFGFGRFVTDKVPPDRIKRKHEIEACSIMGTGWKSVDGYAHVSRISSLNLRFATTAHRSIK